MGFIDTYSLDDHVLQAHIAHIPPQDGFTCQWEACGEAEEDIDQLVDHVKTYHTSHSIQGNGHVCLWQGCNATLSNSEDLSHHLTTVHAAQPSIGGLLCQWEALCGRQFTTTDSLQQHAKDDHIAVLKKKTGYFCLWAGCTRRDKQFSQKGKVERHMQTHTGFKSCRCPHCEKEFSAPQALQQHIRTHTGEKPYKCDICGKEFAQGSAMTMHRRVHTGERPLKCDFPGCDKRFSE
ncbi:hypothetical protein BGX38DRAFT_1094372 [Terfezia claveryi]|nr:hypothetical protein BGX38DRAFT_1108357 [Terfezia claveryi]KAF8445551.1 hypothetical protein BGX38DRAFT_1094372 [Terfezia claveryi]